MKDMIHDHEQRLQFIGKYDLVLVTPESVHPGLILHPRFTRLGIFNQEWERVLIDLPVLGFATALYCAMIEWGMNPQNNYLETDPRSLDPLHCPSIEIYERRAFDAGFYKFLDFAEPDSVELLKILMISDLVWVYGRPYNQICRNLFGITPRHLAACRMG